MPNLTFDYTKSNFPLTSCGTVFYQPESEYQFPDPRDDGFNYCNGDDKNHVDRNQPPFLPINEQYSLTIEDLAEITTMKCKDPLPEWNCLNTMVILYLDMIVSDSLKALSTPLV